MSLPKSSSGLIENIFKYAGVLFKLVAMTIAIIIALHPNPSNHMITIVLGIIACYVINISTDMDFMRSGESLKKDLKLVEYQDLILAELKKSKELNEKAVLLVESQAELLTQMTKIAISKNKQESPN